MLFLVTALDDVALRRQALELLHELGPAAQPATLELIRRIKKAGPHGDHYEGLQSIGPSAKAATPVLRDAMLCHIAEADLLALLDVLNDKDVDTAQYRAQAMEVLGEVGPQAKNTVPAMLNVFHESDSWLRSVAAEEIKKIDRQAA